MAPKPCVRCLFAKLRLLQQKVDYQKRILGRFGLSLNGRSFELENGIPVPKEDHSHGDASTIVRDVYGHDVCIPLEEGSSEISESVYFGNVFNHEICDAITCVCGGCGGKTLDRFYGSSDFCDVSYHRPCSCDCLCDVCDVCGLILGCGRHLKLCSCSYYKRVALRSCLPLVHTWRRVKKTVRRIRNKVVRNLDWIKDWSFFDGNPNYERPAPAERVMSRRRRRLQMQNQVVEEVQPVGPGFAVPGTNGEVAWDECFQMVFDNLPPSWQTRIEMEAQGKNDKEKDKGFLANLWDTKNVAKDFSRNISHLTSVAEKIEVNDVKDVLDAISSTIKDSHINIKHTMDDDLKESLKNALDSISCRVKDKGLSAINIVLQILLVIILLIFAPSIWYAIVVIIFIILSKLQGSSVLSIFGLIKDFVFKASSGLKTLWSKRGSWFKGKSQRDRPNTDSSDGATAQSGDMDAESLTEGLKPVSTLMATCIGVASGSVDERNMPSLLKASQACNAYISMNSFSDVVHSMINRVKATLWEFSTGLPHEYFNIEETYSDITATAKSVDESVHDVEWMKDLYNNKLKQQYVVGLRHRVSEHMRDPKIEKSVALRNILASTNKELTTIIEGLEGLEASCPARIKPVFVVLAGETGVGKTFMTQALVLDVWANLPNAIKAKFNPTKITDLIFNKPVGSEYFEGYTGQFCVAMDELGAIRSGVADHAEVEALNLLGMIGDAQYPLNMANAPLKGKVCFTSPLIIGTTNSLNFKSLKMESLNALRRRRDLLVVPQPKPAFARRVTLAKSAYETLDVNAWNQYNTRLNRSNTMDATRPLHSRFIILDSERDDHDLSKLQGLGVEYPRLVKMVSDLIIQRYSSLQKRTTARDQFFQNSLVAQISTLINYDKIILDLDNRVPQLVPAPAKVKKDDPIYSMKRNMLGPALTYVYDSILEQCDVKEAKDLFGWFVDRPENHPHLGLLLDYEHPYTVIYEYDRFVNFAKHYSAKYQVAHDVWFGSPKNAPIPVPQQDKDLSYDEKAARPDAIYSEDADGNEYVDLIPDEGFNPDPSLIDSLNSQASKLDQKDFTHVKYFYCLMSTLKGTSVAPHKGCKGHWQTCLCQNFLQHEPNKVCNDKFVRNDLLIKAYVIWSNSTTNHAKLFLAYLAMRSMKGKSAQYLWRSLPEFKAFAKIFSLDIYDFIADDLNWGYRQFVDRDMVKDMGMSHHVDYWIQSFKDLPWMKILIVLGSLGVVVTLLAAAAGLYKKTKSNKLVEKVKGFAESHNDRFQNVFKRNGLTKRVHSHRARREDYSSEEINNVQVDLCDDEGWILDAHAVQDKQLEFHQLPHIVNAVVDAQIEAVGRRTKAIIIDPYHILVPRHLILDLRRSAVITFTGFSCLVSYRMSDLQLIDIGNEYDYNDITLVKVPRPFPNPDISNYFVEEKDIKKINDVSGEIIIKEDTNLVRFITKIFSQKQFLEATEPKSVTTGVRVNQPNGQFLNALTGWAYSAPTQKGDCGAPVVRWTNQSAGKILGIHLAGDTHPQSKNKSLGFAGIVTRDWIKKARARFPTKTFESHMLEILEEPPMFLSNNVNILGEVPMEERVYLPGQSKIRPSHIQALVPWQPKKKPAYLTPQPNFSPLQKVMAKFQNSQVIFDNELLDKLSQYFKIKFMYDLSAYTRKPLTDSEMINSTEILHSLNMDSSPGYPWVLEGYKKRDFLEYDGVSRFNKTATYKILHDVIKRFEDDANKDIINEEIWLIFLKDELLPIDKVDEGKVRLFTACPFHITLLTRKYFGNFVNFLHRTWNKHGVCVGITPQSADWGILYRQLESFGPNFVDCDFSNYDRSISPQIMQIFFELAEVYYNGQARKVRQALEQLFLQPTYQVNNVRFRVARGNPSGCPLTVEINSICNYILTFYCILKSNPDLQFDFVLDNTFIATYGDDNIIATRYDYDLDAFQNEFSKIGMTITPASKDGKLRYKSLSDIQFLKRNFREHAGFIFAPLDINSLREAPLWVKHDDNVNMYMEETVRNVFEELNQHSSEDAYPIYAALLNACNRLNLDYKVTEHMIVSLSSCRSESDFWDGTLIQKLAILVYQKFVKTQKQVALYNNEDLTGGCFIRVVDVGLLLPLCPANKIFHSGLYFPDREAELTFGEKGLIWVNYDYEFKIVSDFVKIRELVVPKRKYDLLNYNCLDWTKEMARANGIIFDHQLVSKSWLKKNHPDITAFELEAHMERVGDADVLAGTSTQLIHSTGALDQTHLIGSGNVISSVDLSMLTSGNVRGYTKTWEIANEFNHTLFNLEFPVELRNSALWNKLQNTLYARIDLTFMIKITASKYNYGSLIARWVPTHQEMWPVEPNAQGITSAPSLIIFVGSTDSAKISVPFTYHRRMFKFDIDENWGWFQVKVLNPLQAGTQATSGVTVNLSFTIDDIQMHYLTPKYEIDRHPAMEPQMDEDQKKSSSGVISGISSTVGQIAGTLGNIPIIGSAMAGVSTIAKGVTGVSEMLGLSKPVSMESTRPVIPRLFTGVGNRDGLDMSEILGTDPKNHIDIIPSLFGSNIDELNMEYLATTPTLIRTIKWSIDDIANKELGRFIVNPFMAGDMTRDKIPGYQFSMLGYMAMMFKYWRGGFRFKIQVVATGFHTGVLAVSFAPHQFATVAFSDPYISTQYLDLNDSGVSEMSVCVPYVSDLVYLRVPDVFESTNLRETSSGLLIFWVFNELRTVDESMNEVYINVYMSADENFEMALPDPYKLNSVIYNAPLTGLNVFSSGNFSHVTLFAQGLKEDWLTSSYTPFKAIPPALQSDSTLTMGERIRNVRDILKIFSLKYDTEVVLDPFTTLSVIIPTLHFLTSEEKLAEKGLYETYLDHAIRIMNFSRGSIRQKIITSSFNGQIIASILISDAQDFNWTTSSTGGEGAPWCLTQANINPTLEYQIPFFSSNVSGVNIGSVDSRKVLVSLKSCDSQSVKVRFSLYESIGDDFSAGFIRGVPLIYRKSVEETFYYRLMVLAPMGHPVSFWDNKGYRATSHIWSGTKTSLNWRKSPVSAYGYTFRTVGPQLSPSEFSDLTCPRGGFWAYFLGEEQPPWLTLTLEDGFPKFDYSIDVETQKQMFILFIPRKNTVTFMSKKSSEENYQWSDYYYSQFPKKDFVGSMAIWLFCIYSSGSKSKMGIQVLSALNMTDDDTAQYRQALHEGWVVIDDPQLMKDFDSLLLSIHDFPIFKNSDARRTSRSKSDYLPPFSPISDIPNTTTSSARRITNIIG